MEDRKIQLIEPTYIRDHCDYSFGDLSGQMVPDYHVSEANIKNIQFIECYRDAILSGKKVMTLFIDNIRLYKRDRPESIGYTALEQENDELKALKDRKIKDVSGNDLLKLCAILADMQFIIFTGFEDTPIDNEIFEKIPPNVTAIYASNAIVFGGKVKPFPYGLQRRINGSDNRMEILHRLISEKSGRMVPTALVYVNHSRNGVAERDEINKYFSGPEFLGIASVESGFNLTPEIYYRRIQQHKFVVCPSGNAIGCECHRDWETLYLRRVPIVKRSAYTEKIFEGFPVLFINDWKEVTKQLLVDNDHLYQVAAQSMDLKQLDLNHILTRILGASPSKSTQPNQPLLKKHQQLKVLYEIWVQPEAYSYTGYLPVNKALFGNLGPMLRYISSLEMDHYIFENEEQAESKIITELIHKFENKTQFIINRVYSVVK